MKKILIAALLASAASTAYAADLPSRKAPPPAPVYAPPAFSWTGFYVGVNGGYGWGNMSGAGNTVFGDPSGGFAGGTIGYNYQIGQFVVGLEGQLDWADITKSQTFTDGSTSSLKIDTMANVLGRVGFAADRALFYAAGGYAGADVKGSFFDTVTGLPYSNSGWQNGFSLGGGVEYAWTNNISFKVEYLYTQLADKTYFGGTPDVAKSTASINTIKAGINYRF